MSSQAAGVPPLPWRRNPSAAPLGEKSSLRPFSATPSCISTSTVGGADLSHLKSGAVIYEVYPSERRVRVLRCGRVLGKGAYACCYEVTTSTGVFALKYLDRSPTTRSEVSERARRAEIRTHRLLQHPHIVKFERSFRLQSSDVMLMELCANGTLKDLLKVRPLTTGEAQYMMAQCRSAMVYLHRQRIIHRDLKPENLFLDARVALKVGDFGLSCGSSKSSGGPPRAYRLCGSTHYRAPEVLACSASPATKLAVQDDTLNPEDRSYSFPADVWSFGVVLYTVIVGSPPFEETKLVDGSLSIRYSQAAMVRVKDPLVLEVLHHTLVLDPCARMTMEELGTLPFFATAPTTPPRSLEAFGFRLPKRAAPSSVTVAPRLSAPRPSSVATATVSKAAPRRVAPVSSTPRPRTSAPLSTTAWLSLWKHREERHHAQREQLVCVEMENRIALSMWEGKEREMYELQFYTYCGTREKLVGESEGAHPHLISSLSTRAQLDHFVQRHSGSPAMCAATRSISIPSASVTPRTGRLGISRYVDPFSPRSSRMDAHGRLEAFGAMGSMWGIGSCRSVAGGPAWGAAEVASAIMDVVEARRFVTIETFRGRGAPSVVFVCPVSEVYGLSPPPSPASAVAVAGTPAGLKTTKPTAAASEALVAIGEGRGSVVAPRRRPVMELGRVPLADASEAELWMYWVAYVWQRDQVKEEALDSASTSVVSDIIRASPRVDAPTMGPGFGVGEDVALRRPAEEARRRFRSLRRVDLCQWLCNRAEIVATHPLHTSDKKIGSTSSSHGVAHTSHMSPQTRPFVLALNLFPRLWAIRGVLERFLSLLPLLEVCSLRNTGYYVDPSMLPQRASSAGMANTPCFPALKVLDLSGTMCSNAALERIIDCADQPEAITTLELASCSLLSEVPAIGRLTGLSTLNLSRTLIGGVDWLVSCQSVTHVNLSFCREIRAWDCLGKLPQLRTLSLRGCRLVNANTLALCLQLEELDVSECLQLRDFRPLVTLTALRRLIAAGTCMDHLKWVGKCTALEVVDLSRCSGMTDLGTLPRLNALRFLNLAYSSVRTLTGVSFCSSLTQLDIRGCHALTDFRPLAGCPKVAVSKSRGMNEATASRLHRPPSQK